MTTDYNGDVIASADERQARADACKILLPLSTRYNRRDIDNLTAYILTGEWQATEHVFTETKD